MKNKSFIKILLLCFVSGFFCCKQSRNDSETKKHREIFEINPDRKIQPKIKDLSIDKNVKIDSVSIQEIKTYFDDDFPNIFYYYYQERIDEHLAWSPKLFGRCCSNTDLSFTENLFFEINSNFQIDKYPFSNLSDTQYSTAFVFKKESIVTINLQIDKNKSFLQGKYSNSDLLDDNEIIMKPIRLSLINGYVKSQELFYKNGRVKEMEIYVNDEYEQTVVLLDTPLVQEFAVDAIFKTNDVISLVPKTYYSGTQYDDICISEIQTNLGKIALPVLNEKFNLIELMNRVDN